MDYEVNLAALFPVVKSARQRSNLHVQERERLDPVMRFRRLGKIVLMCVRLCKLSRESVDSSKGEFLSVIQYLDTIRTVDRGGLFFDPSEYKAKKEERIPQEARRILQEQQENRSVKEIQYLQIILRKIKAFGEYPTKMQRRLCEVGWFEAYEPRRAIVLQDHSPQSFYFILCGTVMVTSYNKKDGSTKLLVSLHRGMSFGELAVITKKRRQATVSTHTYTELLCISASDFEAIFMAGGIRSVTDPDHNAFLRSVRCLRDWPINSLSQNPQACMFHYFNRGEILVRDSNRSDWIYIVKSGSLSVLKKLRKVKPEKQRPHTERPSGDNETRSKIFGSWSNRAQSRRKNMQQHRPQSENITETFKNNYEMERRLEQTLPGYYNTSDRLGMIDYEDIINKHRTRVVKNQETESTNEDEPDKGRPESEMSSSSEERIPLLPKIHKTSKGAYLSSGTSRKKKSKKKETLSAEIARKEMELQQKLSKQKEGRKTIADEYDNRPPSRIVLTEADIHPMFIVIQILERGQYFGISTMIYQDQPSLSLVSNGAECIMISKKFFMEKKTDATMRSIYQSESPFPNDEMLQKQLQATVNWQSHRQRIYQRIVGQLKDRKLKHQQFAPQYQGQYSFRTGPL